MFKIYRFSTVLFHTTYTFSTASSNNTVISRFLRHCILSSLLILFHLHFIFNYSHNTFVKLSLLYLHWDLPIWMKINACFLFITQIWTFQTKWEGLSLSLYTTLLLWKQRVNLNRCLIEVECWNCPWFSSSEEDFCMLSTAGVLNAISYKIFFCWFFKLHWTSTCTCELQGFRQKMTL